MKRNDIWLGVVLGILLGLLVGFYAGHTFSNDAAAGDAPRKADAASQIESAHGGDAGAGTGASSTERIKRFMAAAERAEDGRPTPGITEAMVAALREEESYSQAGLLMLVDSMRKEDFPIVLEILRKAKTNVHSRSLSGQGPPVWITFWRRFGERDPTGALASALHSGDLNYANRNLLEKFVFTGMASKDPRAAADAYLAHSDVLARTTAAEGLVYQWARADPKAAAEWAAKNLTGDTRNSAYYGLAWGASNSDDIVGGNALVKDMPDTPDRASVLRSIKSQISFKTQVPAQQILDFITINRAIGARDRKFESQMATRCAAVDPMAAANFFSQPLADGGENDFAELKIVSAQWAARDPKAAGNWAKGQEGTPHYEAIATEFAHAAQAQGDTAGAQRWLDAIAAQAGKNKPPR